MVGTDPPRCAAHGGGKAPVGPPAGNRNAETHGLHSSHPAPDIKAPTIEEVYADLAARLKRFADYLDNAEDLSVHVYAQLLEAYGQVSSRLARILTVKDRISTGAVDELEKAIDQVLDELGEDWGVEL